MTDQELAEIEARANAATPGPWKAKPREDDRNERCAGIVALRPDADDEWDRELDVVVTDSGVYPPDPKTAEFIAHAREDVPKLIAEVRKLRAERDEAIERCAGVADHYARLSWHAHNVTNVGIDTRPVQAAAVAAEHIANGIRQLKNPH